LRVFFVSHSTASAGVTTSTRVLSLAAEAVGSVGCAGVLLLFFVVIVVSPSPRGRRGSRSIASRRW
jgi:hypothetical protein